MQVFSPQHSQSLKALVQWCRGSHLRSLSFFYFILFTLLDQLIRRDNFFVLVVRDQGCTTFPQHSHSRNPRFSVLLPFFHTMHSGRPSSMPDV